MKNSHKNKATFLYLANRNLFKNSMAKSYLEFEANKKYENNLLTRESIRKGTKKIT